MKSFVIAIATLALLAPALAGAQSPAPPAPQAPPASPAPPAPATPPAPGSPSTPAPDPAQPRTPAPATPDATAPRAPDAPAAPGARVEGEGRVFGLSPLVAVIFGLIILGVIIALLAGRRRDRDVVVDTRIDAPFPPERPLGTPESDIERERRRRAS
jgi:2-oxoglutarate dehydrogenase E2 component (dihydrolipoamide succinyltransferase)